MKTYTVTLTHTEVIAVEAENEEDALEKLILKRNTSATGTNLRSTI